MGGQSLALRYALPHVVSGRALRRGTWAETCGPPGIWASQGMFATTAAGGLCKHARLQAERRPACVAWPPTKMVLGIGSERGPPRSATLRGRVYPAATALTLRELGGPEYIRLKRYILRTCCLGERGPGHHGGLHADAPVQPKHNGARPCYPRRAPGCPSWPVTGTNLAES
jgi:hypothetical protein